MNYRPLPDLIPFNELSDHPGEALLQAVHDLKIAMKTKNVSANMSVYLQTIKNGEVCCVCLAGSTLLNDFYFNNVSIKENFCLNPEKVYKAKDSRRLTAIDLFRRSSIAKGLRCFFEDETPEKYLSDFYKEIEFYFHKNCHRPWEWQFVIFPDPDKFLKQMTDLGEYLLSFPLEYLNGECKLL